MSLKDELIKVSENFPAELKEQRDGSLAMKFVIAERKAFLSKKKLTYKCKARVNDDKKEVTFFEMLSESNSGLSAGSGFEFKKETFGTKGKEREGGIEEMSNLFGKKFTYSFDYKKIREALKEEAQKTGYPFSVKVIEKSV